MQNLPVATCIALTAFLAICVATPGRAATYFVDQRAPGASDESPGTETEPLATINAAMSKVQPGDTVFVKSGVYREEVRFPGEDWGDPSTRITLSAFPGHRPVISGSDPVTGNWERLPGEKPIYAGPRDTYTQMVFVDEERIRQIGLQGSPKRAESTNGFQFKKQWDGKGIEDMVPGSFFYDADAKRLHLWLADGSDPSERRVEASVRGRGVSLGGTWTLSGFDIRNVMDGFWPNEQAVSVGGKRCIVENCRITQNGFIGLIVSGEDCVIRGNEVSHNGLMGFTSNNGFRMRVEGNEFHHNAWRGDVVCLTAGNKWVMWRDSTFIRNWWHDESASALWLDINDGNVLIAENRFDNCNVGIYFEISRWAVIANNVLRDCGRGIWIYSADTLVAHNALDRCGEGITVSGYPRTARHGQVTAERTGNCVMAVRNNLMVNNLLIDCPGSYIGITSDTAFGAANYSDYNAFVWTLPAFHRSGNHINFMDSWGTLYARLPEWRYQRHYDTHSVVADVGLLRQVQAGSPWVAMASRDVLGDPMIAARDLGDYNLLPGSPLRGRGIRIPQVLDAGYIRGEGREIASRQWAKTRLADAPDPDVTKSVYGGENGHYRLQPLPGFRRLFDLDSQPPGTPGLNRTWIETGDYPTFDSTRQPKVAGDTDWMVFPDNRLSDPSFVEPITKGTEADGPGPWHGRGGMHASSRMACANLLPQNRAGATAFQKVGKVAPDCEYILFGDMTVSSRHEGFAAIGELYLAVGEGLKPIGKKGSMKAQPGKARSWNTCDAHYRSGSADEDQAVGQDLYVVIKGTSEGPADVQGSTPVAFVRWDNLTLLTGEEPEG